MIDKLLARIEVLEHQVKEMREILTQEQGLTMVQQALIYSLRAWQDERHLPHTSADEVDRLKLARSEREWLQDWMNRWNATRKYSIQGVQVSVM